MKYYNVMEDPQTTIAVSNEVVTSYFRRKPAKYIFLWIFGIVFWKCPLLGVLMTFFLKQYLM